MTMRGVLALAWIVALASASPGLSASALARPAQALAWSEPLALSALSTSAVAANPELVVDAEGRVHVLWYSVLDRPAEEGGGLTDAIVYMARTGGVWSSIEPVYSRDRPPYADTSSPLSSDAAANNPAFVLRASAASARDSRLHLAVGDANAQWHLGAPWAEVVRLTSLLPPVALGEGQESALTSPADGSLHVVLSAIPRGAEEPPQVGGAQCLACLEIVYRRSVDGGVTWSRPENLSRFGGEDAAPRIAADDQGRLHLLWEHRAAQPSDEPPFLLYERSDDGGQTWLPPQILGAPGEGSVQPALGLAPGGRLLAVYAGASTGSVFFQSSGDSGQSWSPPGLVPGVLSPGAGAADSRRFDLAVDGAGRIYLLMVGALPGENGAGMGLLLLSWDGQSWSAPATLPGGDAPASPRLFIERGRVLHAVWATGELDAAGDRRQSIWYSGAPLEAPELVPLPTFTPAVTPLPTAAPTGTPAPTPTLLPDASRAVETIEGPPRWEAEGLEALMIALGPVLLLLGLVFWWATRRGRGRG